MKTKYSILVSLFVGAGAIAQQPGKLSFSGTWTLQTDTTIKLLVQQSDLGIRVQELKGDQTKSDYKCNLDGKDCAFKEEGHSAKVALWLNGPKLVELRTHGNTIVRRRFTLDDDGKKLAVELSPMSSPGKTEILHYSRQ